MRAFMQKQEKSKSEITKETILSAVEKLMKRMDLSEMNVRQICKEAGISIGTFYLYFPCKEAAVLYCYRQADEVFETMELINTPLENIRHILTTFMHMVNLEDMETVKQLYVCHIKYHDPYYFSEKRSVFVRLYEQLNAMIGKEEISKDIAMKLLTMARGMIFHLCCIDQEQIPNNWHSICIEDLMQSVCDNEKRYRQELGE